MLSLIKRYRTRLPINGVIITVSMKEVIEKPKKIEQDLLNYRARIDKINIKFKLNLPVQVIFTHMDCLQGCEGFISQFSEVAKGQATVVREERNQEALYGDPITVIFKFRSLKPENVLEELVLHPFHLSKEVLE